MTEAEVNIWKTIWKEGNNQGFDMNETDAHDLFLSIKPLIDDHVNKAQDRSFKVGFSFGTKQTLEQIAMALSNDDDYEDKKDSFMNSLEYSYLVDLKLTNSSEVSKTVSKSIDNWSNYIRNKIIKG